jgi:hypothetical protein
MLNYLKCEFLHSLTAKPDILSDLFKSEINDLLGSLSLMHLDQWHVLRILSYLQFQMP